MPEKRAKTQHLIAHYGFSVSKACKVLELSRSSYYYQVKREADGLLAKALLKRHHCHRVDGFWKLFYRLRAQGHTWNHKRVFRIYQELGLSLARRTAKKKNKRPACPLKVPQQTNVCWSVDFMSDAFDNGAGKNIPFRALNIIDDFNREVLCVEIGRSISAKHLLRKLGELIEVRGKPQAIRSDNGPEYLAKVVKQWARKHQIDWRYIQPGKPTQNAYVVRFNGTLRQELFNLHIFDSLEQVSELLEGWIEDFNQLRPHKALKYLSPVAFAQKYDKRKLSS
ncbi:MAG: IS3 family transposase [Bacteroidota bacterium]